jgi:Mrp family chromosome partitioning ATPase/uncharacterized protein involved in exopolysaccharide biosynthesis
VVVGFAIVGGVVGLVASLSFGERSYVSETVLMFHPAATAEGDTSSSLDTILNLVKVPANLEGVNRKLREDTPLPALAASFQIRSVKNTDLVAIAATADTARQAADRANALRDAFLANQAKLAIEKGERQSVVVAKQLEEVKAALSAADQKRIDIGIQTGVIDLEKQTGTYLQQQASMDIFYGQAVADRTAVDEQNLTLDQAAKDLQKKIEKEQKLAGAQEDLSSLNIRSGRLRSSIEEDRKDRAAKAELAQKEAEFKRASELAAEGLLSKALLDKAQAEYEAAKAKAVDTEQIQEWKAELARIDKGVIPTKANDTPSTSILREVMSKRLDLGLQKTAVAERVKSLDASRNLIKARVERLPELKRQLADVGREVESLEQRRRTLEDLLAKARAAAGATSADFTVVSPAVPPIFPKSSNRMLVLAACLILFTGASVVLVLGVELLDRTIRSGPEVLIRTGARLLASVPRLPADLASLPSNQVTPVLGFFRRVAYQIRRENPGALRILVTSAHRGEGATFVASQLAAAFGRLDERVVYVDSRLQAAAPVDLRSLALTRDPMKGGKIFPAEVEASIFVALLAGLQRLRAVLARFRRHPRTWPIRAKRPAVHIRRAVRFVKARARAIALWVRTHLMSILWPAPPEASAPLAFATPGGDGLGSYLSYRRHSSKEVAHPTSLIGLSCLPADMVEAPLPESIAWRRMQDLVSELSVRYPVVVIDASGLLDDPDPEVLADQSDVVLVVARAEQTLARDIKRTITRLAAAKARMGGVILNGVDRAFADLITEAEA